MPYIDKKRRGFVEPFPLLTPDNPGELTYQITKLCTAYLEKKDLSFQTIAEIVGALECTKGEFQRRVVGKYEDQKIKQNGDVY